MGKGSSGGAAACNNNQEVPVQSSDLPTIIVFDLDDCLWTPEMHELSGMPSIPVEGPLDPNDNQSTLGVVGMKVPSRRRGRGGGFDWGGYNTDDEEVVELYPGARLALRELVMNPKYRGIKVAFASTSLEPSYSRACLDGIEIVEGVTMRSIVSHAQIGRSGRLTSRKTTHFRLIHEESGVPYEEMLFFGKCIDCCCRIYCLQSSLYLPDKTTQINSMLDDCNWGDHVGDVNKEFGVVGVRTPQGLRLEEFHLGLDKFRAGRAK